MDQECKQCKKSFKALLKHIVKSKKCEDFYGDELEDLKQDLAAAAAKNVEYEDQLTGFSLGPDDLARKYAETSRKIAVLKSNEAMITRKYRVVEE